jgi:hypothetical protein
VGGWKLTCDDILSFGCSGAASYINLPWAEEGGEEVLRAPLGDTTEIMLGLSG